jgi:hypothetical protein
VTQQNTAMIEEASAAGHSPRSEAESLSALVETVARIGGAETRRTNKPAPERQPRTAQPAAAVSNDGWQQF